jgi:ABC-type transport system involved in multi-copper enzyme maturation permease subunit
VSQIAAIALLALRNALRSRIILVLLLLVLAAGFLLPLTIRSDGTLDGLIRLHLAYTLGIASFLLSLATLWAGCAAISQEADDKTLQLLLVKPVPRLRIWLGKWLALLAINALILAFVGMLSVATLRAKITRAGFDADTRSAARQTTLASLQTLHAPLPDIEAAVRAEYDALRARHTLPENATEAALLDSIRRSQLARLYSIAPGAARTWNFGPFAPLSQTLLIQFKSDSSIPGAADIQATLSLEAGDKIFTRAIRAMPGNPQTVIFREIPAGATRANATISNQSAHAATLFFDPSDGLVLRQPHGTFAGNYVRALAQLFLRLALFAAIGITLGTLFSMPVATFLALVLIFILQLSGFVSAAAQVDRATFVANVAPFGASGHSHGDAESTSETEPALVARATATVLFYVYRGTYLTLRPLLEDRTLDALSAGTRLPPRELLRNALQQGLVLPLLLALLSTAVLRKREWALPSTS